MTTAPPPAPPSTSRPITPSMRWVIFAIVLLVVGPGGCIVGAVSQTVSLVEGLDEFGRFQLPVEDHPMRIDEVVDDGAVYVDGAVSAFGALSEFSLVGEEGDEIDLRPSTGTSFDFSDGSTDTELIKVGTFEVTDPGDYLLTASAGEDGTAREIFIGRDISDSKVVGILLYVVIGGLVGLVGLILLIVFLVRRGRSKREQSGPWGGGYPPGGYPQPGYPQPGYPPAPGYGPPPGPGYGPPPGPGYAPPPGPGYAPPPGYVPPAPPGYVPPQPGYVPPPPGQPGPTPTPTPTPEPAPGAAPGSEPPAGWEPPSESESPR